MSTKDDLNHYIWRQLQCSDVVGDILRFALFVESSVEGILVDYYVPGSRREAFERLVEHLSFYQKLELFAALPLVRPLQSHKILCSIFSSTRRLRNHVAHTYTYNDTIVQKLANDQNILRWLRDFPDELEHEYSAVRNRLGALRRAKSFCTSTWEDDPRDIPF